MAEEKDWLYEEDGCANCGEIDYVPSKVPGLCKECLEENCKHEEELV